MQYVVIDIPHYKKAAGIDPSENNFRTPKKHVSIEYLDCFAGTRKHLPAKHR